MRRLALAVLALCLIGGGVYTAGVGPGPLGHSQKKGGGLVTILDLPLDSNGVTSVTDLPSTIPTPTIAWFGFDPLVNHGSGGGSFAVEDGATDAAQTPFCPDGDYSDLSDTGDPASKSCLQARHFDGNDSYVFSSTTIAQPSTIDYSMCAVVKPQSSGGGQDGIAGARGAAGTNGVGLTHAEGTAAYFVWDGADAGQFESVGGGVVGGWYILCGSGDYDGNITVYQNVTDGGNTASASGDMSTGGVAFKIGELAGTGFFAGDIAAVYAWPGTALTSDQVKAFTWHWMGLLPTSGGTFTTLPSSAATDGAVCCWVNDTAATQALECFADDWPPIGCGVNPGATNAGNTGGMLSLNQFTNLLVQSRDFSAGWTEAGTVIGATSTAASPFTDAAYKPVYLLEDDDAGAAEYIYQVVDTTVLGTGFDVAVTVFARSDSGAKGLDVQVVEQTGCVGSTIDFDAVEITTTWEPYQFFWDYADGDCTEAVIRVGPVSGAHPADIATVAETGAMYAMIQLTRNMTTAAPVYLESVASSGVSGNMGPLWTATAANLIGTASSKDTIYLDVTLGHDSWPQASNGIVYYVGGQQFSVASNSSTFQYIDTGANNVHSINAVAIATAGVTVTTKWVNDWGLDEYEVFFDDVSKSTKSTADSPDLTKTSSAVGRFISGVSGTSGAFLKNFKLTRE